MTISGLALGLLYSASVLIQALLSVGSVTTGVSEVTRTMGGITTLYSVSLYNILSYLLSYSTHSTIKLQPSASPDSYKPFYPFFPIFLSFYLLFYFISFFKFL